MSNKFEHKIKASVEGFELEPSALVWDDIEKNLPKKERKRRAIFWWMFPLIILMGGGVYFSRQSRDSSQQTTVNRQQIIDNSQQATGNSKQVTETKEAGIIVDNNAKAINARNNKTVQQTNKITLNAKLQTITNEKQAARNPIDEKQETPMEVLTSPNPKLQTITNEKQAARNPIDEKQKTINETKDKKQKSSWNYYISIGNNVNTETIFGKQDDEKTSGYSFPTTSIPSGGVVNISPIGLVTLPQSALTFSVGISNQQQVTKNLELQLLMGLRYRNGKTFVGKDSLSGNSQFYNTGSSTYTNNLWQAELGVQLNAILNPKNKNQFFIATGLGTQATLSNNWLAVQKGLNVYEANKNTTNFLIINANVGLGYKLNSGLRVQLNMQQSLNSIKKVATKNFLRAVELRIQFPMKLKNK